jgi:hypothetical protein
MLSPGRRYLAVPTDFAGNREYRLEWLKKAAKSKLVRDDLKRACRDDFLFYLRVFAWQYNPDNVGREVGLFIPWPWQEDTLQRTMQRLFVDRRGVVWEKSRKMGATWMALFLQDWAARFHEMKKFLVMSHTQAAVDTSGDMDSLFEKVQFINDKLPGWLRGDFARKKLLIRYPDSKSALSGVGTTQRSGVGGRATAIMNDEFSKYRDDYKILGQLKDVGPSLYIGTHYGVGGAFYDLCTRPDQFKIVLHWTLHPRYKQGLYKFNPKVPGNVEYLDPGYEHKPGYNFILDGSPTGGPCPGLRSPWYDAECIERGNRRDVAMHLDIDPAGSSFQFFDPISIRDHVRRYSREPVWRGELDYDPDTGRFKGLIPETRGRLKLWIRPDSNGRLPPSKYTAGTDVAAGTGATPSTYSGFDGPKGIKVLEWSDNRIDPKDFGPLAVALCWLLKDEEERGAQIVWETAGAVGYKFGESVLKTGYRNCWIRPRDQWQANTKMSDNYGWAPNRTGAKYSLLSDYRKALEKGDYLNPSESSLLETLEFRYDVGQEVVHGKSDTTDDVTAKASSHGDMVIADALGWMLAKEMGAAKKAAQARELDEQDVPVFSVDWWARQNALGRARSWA